MIFKKKEPSQNPWIQSKPVLLFQKFLPVILIVCGFIVLAIPLITRAYESYVNYQEMQEIGNIFDELQALEEIENIVEPDPSTGDIDPTPANGNSTIKLPSGKTLIGTLSMPSISKKILIFEGGTENELKSGAGHLPNTAGMGEAGNFVLAGHRSTKDNVLFNRLGKIKVGDTFYAQDIKQYTYIYRVFEVLIVKPSESWVMTQDKSQTIMTLITCDPIGVASHRLIIRARYIPEESNPRPALKPQITQIATPTKGKTPVTPSLQSAIPLIAPNTTITPMKSIEPIETPTPISTPS